ncbi:MAG: hypothetical protein GX619_03935 [Bacteroidales bacterium]|nr:hypothetical protein [Bacteroidales bacterium]HBL73572.1 hypothetical protein [Bacteroidales bacterium]
MKHVQLLKGLPMVALLLLTACEQEQTALTIDAIAGKASIKGRVIYKSGETQTGQYVGEVWNLAAGQTVYAYLSNADLTGDPGAPGETAYEATVDANGDYLLEVPATATGVSVRLEFSSFEGTYRQAAGINTTTGELTFRDFTGYYSAGASVLTVKNNLAYIEDYDAYAFTARTALGETTVTTEDYVKVSGLLTYSAESRNADSTLVTIVRRPAVGQKILVGLSGAWYSAMAQSIPVGEENMAVFEVYLPTSDNSWTTNITLRPVSYESYYLDYILSGGKYAITKTLKGKYTWDGLNGTQTVTLEKGFTSYLGSALNYTFQAYPDYAQ